MQLQTGCHAISISMYLFLLLPSGTSIRRRVDPIQPKIIHIADEGNLFFWLEKGEKVSTFTNKTS